MRSEGGAVLVTVVLMLALIVAMLTIVIDVGVAVVTKQRLATAAEAASLAAAQSCATGTADVTSLDEQYATKNSVTGATSELIQPPRCGLEFGDATATFSADAERITASLIPGVSPTSDVGVEATAIWGPSQNAHALPIALLPAGRDLDETACMDDDGCSFLLDPVPPEEEDDRNFAAARLVGPCDLEAPVIDQIWGAQPLPWIRTRDRLCVASIDTINLPALNSALDFLEGKVGVFPVARGGNERIAIRGFSPLEVLASNSVVRSENGTCERYSHDFTTSPPGDTLNILSGPTIPFCGIPPGASLSVDVEKNGSPLGGFTFNESTNEVTWTGNEDINNVDVIVSWTTAANLGGCAADEDALLGNEVCLQLRHLGPQVGGSEPVMDVNGSNPEERDYGFRAVRLTG